MSSLSVTANVPQTHSLGRTFVQRYAVWLFFVLAFALTWMIEIPVVLDARGALPFHIPFIFQLLMGFMPGVAALILAALASGKAGVMDLVRRVVRWRVGVQWYLIAVLGSAALYFSAVGVGVLLGAQVPTLPEFSPLLIAGFFVQLGIYLVFNWEDIGWRGFALTRLQATQSALVASLILGVVEGLFHIPLFFSPTSSQSSSPFWAFMLSSIGGALVLNWVFNNARGSVLIASLTHAAINTWTDVVVIPRNSTLGWIVFDLSFCVLAVVIVVVFGARYLSRKPQTEIPIVTDPISG